ncbi:MAG TPA: hypothetical protein DDW91_10605, partial [Shewanella frigidimarina]|nr:hypothetical protein [Shewanella frigidimarina]
LAPILKRSPVARFTLKQFEHVNADLVSRYLKAASKQQLTGVNILLYGAEGQCSSACLNTLSHSSINNRLSSDPPSKPCIKLR